MAGFLTEEQVVTLRQAHKTVRDKRLVDRIKAVLYLNYGLTYPDKMALSYDKIDPVLFLLTEKQLTVEEISQQFNIDLNWLKRLKSHLEKALFQAPVSQLII